MNGAVERLRETVQAANGHAVYVWPNDVLALLDRLERIRALTDEQAEDEGLWFFAQTAPEAYLQQELRRLHAVIEGSK